MANRLKGETLLKLADGREFVLVLDMEAMLSVEDSMGKPLPQVMKMAQDGFMTAVAAIAQAAFTRHHPDVSRADVLDVLRTDAEALEKALAATTMAAFPNEAKAGNGKAGSPQVGTISGASGAKPD